MLAWLSTKTQLHTNKSKRKWADFADLSVFVLMTTYYKAFHHIFCFWLLPLTSCVIQYCEGLVNFPYFRQTLLLCCKDDDRNYFLHWRGIFQNALFPLLIIKQEHTGGFRSICFLYNQDDNGWSGMHDIISEDHFRHTFYMYTWVSRDWKRSEDR